MKRFVLPLFVLFSSTTFAALDTGTGADGSCVLAGALDTDTQSEYNCTELSVSGAITVSGSLPLIIKVQGDASIANTITVTAGEAGGYAAGTGPLAGAEGGNATDSSCDGATFVDIGGPGGAGGSHASLGGSSGTATSSAAPSGGDVIGTAGTTTVTYDSALSLETQMRGGSGGGNGGAGCDGISADVETGATPGGAGGGVLQITAGGDIYINAAITADGADGNPGSQTSNAAGGGSGGGAGGIIFLQANGEIEVNANISAVGGAGGLGGDNGGNGYAGDGGDGGDGIIRLDDLDGAVTGSGSISPTPTYVTLGASGFETLSSGIEPGCAVREDMTPKNQSILGAMILLFLLIGLNLKELKKAHTRW